MLSRKELKEVIDEIEDSRSETEAIHNIIENAEPSGSRKLVTKAHFNEIRLDDKKTVWKKVEVLHSGMYLVEKV